MLDANLKTQLKSYLEKLTQPVEIVSSVDDSAKSNEMTAMLRDIAELSDLISLTERRDDAERKPSFSINRAGGKIDIRFAAIPMGHEFTSLVLALLQVGGHPPKAEPEVLEQIRALDGTFRFETYISLSCQNCPEVVQALNLMSTLNPGISHVMIDGALFQDEVNSRRIMAVPTIYLNGELFGQGRMGLKEILGKIDTGGARREADKISAKEPFDVLVIGGGPAGAAAAIYTARKGIRIGLIAENFGGQVLNTLAIENLIGVKETEGPKLASALEENVRSYDVDVMLPQRAEKLIPGDLIEIRLASGASVKSKTVILATGARWRQLGVPGEQEYMAKGVAFCPHCDGPLFKGKNIAVVGGGNSAVEAAIDLAGIVNHVTMLVRNTHLRADTVLQKKMLSLPNLTLETQAQIIEIAGDDGRVNGITYQDRATGTNRHLALDGVFVQIGLDPITGWLADSVELNQHGEIVVDSHGRTSIPGVFAAGDATSGPYKQIIVSMGDGAKAALSAFDHLIRN
jgi:alkyl hydroperoxide reductase subunit F